LLTEIKVEIEKTRGAFQKGLGSHEFLCFGLLGEFHMLLRIFYTFENMSAL